MILIKFNEIKNDYEVINDSDLQLFTKYGGLNHYDDGYNFKILSNIYNCIKNERNNLLIPEISFNNNLFYKFFKLGRNRNYNISNIYYDDTIYYNTEMDKFTREVIFNNYIRTLSLNDNILSISFYSGETYKYHKNRLGLNSNQNIIPIKLGVIDCINKHKFDNNIKLESNLIISNISKTERKNYKNLIEAFKVLRNVYPNFKLIIFGNCWENKYDTLNNIEFKSFITNEEKQNLFDNCLFSVYPSLKEGYGIPIYESLMKGKCVICHNETSTLEIAKDISQPCVSAVNCKDVNVLFEEMNKYCNKEYLVNAQKSIKNVKFKTYKKYTEEVYSSLTNKKNKYIFYYIDHTCQTNVRTGVQNYSISVAKKLIKSFEIIFVKWDEQKCSLVNCNYNQINHLFNYNNKNPVNLEKYRDYKENFEIHKKYKLEDFTFICPQPTFLTTYKFQPTNEIFKYLKFYNLYNVFVVYDLIPILLDGYEDIKLNFTYYLNNLLQADKIIFISNKTRKDLIHYYSKFGNYSLDIDHLLLPYQFRYTNKVLHKENKEDCINILLSGTVEPRKQQIKLMKMFNNLMSQKDYNVKLIIYGSINPFLKKEFDNQLNLSNKIEYLGIISDEKIIDLYKNASFSCFISKHEGYGFPVAESLWMKTPVLCSNIEPLTEISEIGGCLLVNPDDDNNIYLDLKN